MSVTTGREFISANPRKMDVCLSCLLSCGLRSRQKEHDFAFVHFNLDTAEMNSLPVVTLIFKLFSKRFPSART
ncbi:MAG: hypothetical protein IIX62_03645, partial [Peptococcaceae bacterium]|nr:hypothetical protein [Peptococcaceae bacterium]